MLLGQVPESVVWAIYFAPVASTLLITAGLIARRLFGFPFRDSWAGRLTILAIGIAFLAALWTLDSSIGADGEALGFQPHLCSTCSTAHRMGVRIGASLRSWPSSSPAFRCRPDSTRRLSTATAATRALAFMALSRGDAGTGGRLGLLQCSAHGSWSGCLRTSESALVPRPGGAAAAKKRFIVTRFGDFAVLLAVLLIFGKTAPSTSTRSTSWSLAGALSFSVRSASPSACSPADRKSAHARLHIWRRRDGGPAPVSALSFPPRRCVARST